MNKYYILLVNFFILISAKTHPKNKTQRIIGGTYTNVANYPYQVVLEYWNQNKNQYEYICGASLITWKHVLTAGHCAKDFQANYYLVKVGLDGWNNPIANQMSYVEQIFVHPSYQKIANEPINDIAVLKMSQQFTQTQTVNIIPLPPLGSYPSNQYLCTITGFGKTKSEDASPSPYLLKADVTIISNNVCWNAVKSLVPSSNPSIGTNNFCTMNNPTKGSCAGDSGGPLMQFGQLIGVISWGVSPCELNNNPTVYTRVSAYVDWIGSVTKI